MHQEVGRRFPVETATLRTIFRTADRTLYQSNFDVPCCMTTKGRPRDVTDFFRFNGNTCWTDEHADSWWCVVAFATMVAASCFWICIISPCRFANSWVSGSSGAMESGWYDVFPFVVVDYFLPFPMSNCGCFSCRRIKLSPRTDLVFASCSFNAFGAVSVSMMKQTKVVYKLTT